MIEEGLLETVAVPTARGNVICIQLTEKGAATFAELETNRVNTKQAAVEEDNEMEELEFHDENYEWAGRYWSFIVWKYVDGPQMKTALNEAWGYNVRS